MSKGFNYYLTIEQIKKNLLWEISCQLGVNKISQVMERLYRRKKRENSEKKGEKKREKRKGKGVER